ncbi:hypothetical protein AK812_SmicGene43870 [Symbiodinium microadriaticum]|uniref:Uncharacterized protein n=1 Tax=Symbiodinium microadriaticum TaxID=2951 RepID=A0A1Q9BZX1_SYMMI|nr:hypothetical protein AK812_SmicGene43870 [Symbiodinium microadriaticum]
MHCQPLKSVLGVNSYAEELGAPSRHQFSTLFKMKEGDSLRSCNDFKQSSDKTHLMAWCLAEARLRLFLYDSVAVRAAVSYTFWNGAIWVDVLQCLGCVG